MALIKFGNEIEKITNMNRELFHVRLKYSDGFEGEVDLSGIFGKPIGLASEIMRGELFERCFVEARVKQKAPILREEYRGLVI